MIPVLYEDKYLILCEKPVGVLSAPEPGRRQNMPDLLKKQTRAYRIDVIHRLDQPVGGVMVYSKSSKATPGLYKQMAGHHFIKEYLAVVTGIPATPQGEWVDWLLKDAARCKSRTVRPGTPGAKEAKLSYQVLQTVVKDGMSLTLVRIQLYTGRTHQIRVQFSSRRLPLLGDEKYGGASLDMKGLPLWSCHLKFRHPVTGQDVEGVSLPPRTYPWNLFKIEG